MRRLALAAAALLGLAMVSCAGGGTPTGGGPSGTGRQPTHLAPAEVRQYRGEQLSSVDDLRENSIKGPQKIDPKTYRLKVVGLVDRPLSLTYDEILALKSYEKVVTLDCVEGWSVTILWQGPLVRDVLARAGVEPRARVVVFRCRDGYSTSFPLDYFSQKDIILAHHMNAVPLPAERGFPLQLIAEDKWGYKWAKWIDSIELSGDEGFRGYWESRGYSNTGDRDEPFFAP